MKMHLSKETSPWVGRPEAWWGAGTVSQGCRQASTDRELLDSPGQRHGPDCAALGPRKTSRGHRGREGAPSHREPRGLSASSHGAGWSTRPHLLLELRKKEMVQMWCMGV